ncbi:NAD(+)/NADH kinase [Thermoanaerobacter brockii subsp. lactiethylicus]|jgi:NAD+ kinase|uniref:NAD kinase n=3 Tax=Thermoanaerobacter TaxID=1754 RepID=NADK_THEP3|nr:MULTISPECIES: NAD(+)/NADH kinase [Thermoanaerobacter]B0K0V4.1 RecName: Full=NAD kinase; AltName: Full=ATP-dependent NAD kinase [Thermoanaerobacter sp. X514]B0K9E7.1 RecName: Full=NAD kinase; AltName: Full=ATP-dependent NAD kinase [Thermoanaerobacter pseudethanolicus ATCC 33223]ABY92829.1 ATP-NAD/AcoX kinase [Thermoanaerobacter sp. X514]ABY94760.1 ATP-NAD/AcoX kinase [Thermoanaerobacter pseudethanolicus ATCC 33223]ADV79708.1 NAD(+) kinase [Thermoanaerobacter brockii subsp. finnii Ako-1]MBZ4
MKKVGVIPNINKDKDLEVTKSVVKWLLEHDSEPYLNEIVASKMGYDEYGKKSTDIYSKSDFIIALGGDGTILNVARLCAPFGTPIFAVNLGHLGFLTEVDMNEVFVSLDKIYKGEYTVEKRMMLEANVVKNDMEIINFRALNDIVITRGAFSRMARINAYVNNNYVDTYLADGVIIATPTGSTAYSLSAGGPIVYPTVEVIIITPICPHTLYSRSIIVSPDDVIRLEISEENQDLMITTDGQQGYKLDYRDIIYIKKSNEYTNLIRVKNTNFFDLLRDKLTER